MADAKIVSLSTVLAKSPEFQRFGMWIVGDTPLITHAWAEKAKREMLDKQLKKVKPSGKEARDPDQDFVNSLYKMGDEVFGFPVTGVKNCIMSAAHKDKGIARSAVMSALYLDAEMVRVLPALAGAICDMPLVRIYSNQPEMREDMVRIGSGLNKTANLAYRGQFTVWGMFITGRINATVIPMETLAFLVEESGSSCGIGEWRNEKKGVFGSFHLALPGEVKVWDKFKAGKGKLPKPKTYSLSADAFEKEVA